jgi:hypothetical protein
VARARWITEHGYRHLPGSRRRVVNVTDAFAAARGGLQSASRRNCWGVRCAARALLAYKRGEPRVCAMVKAPTPEEEDRSALPRAQGSDRRAG